MPTDLAVTNGAHTHATEPSPTRPASNKTKSTKSKLIDALGRSGSPTNFNDENLRTLHAYLFLALVQTDWELKRRGLSNGEEVLLQIASPA